MSSSAPSSPNAWTKADIVNHLAGTCGYRTYLEFCTLTTGFLYRQIDRSKFDTCHRLMYRCADNFDDGMDIDFHSSGNDIGDCLRKIKATGLRYDVVLVDPFHEYDESYRDLQEAFDMVEDHGAIVVHDCLPPDEQIANPRYIEGPWCGVTYKAYLDFVTSRDDLVYATLDTDYGCGIIVKNTSRAPLQDVLAEDRDARNARTQLVEEWRRIGNDFPAAFRCFQDNQRTLLRLMTVEDFLQRQRTRVHG